MSIVCAQSKLQTAVLATTKCFDQTELTRSDFQKLRDASIPGMGSRHRKNRQATRHRRKQPSIIVRTDTAHVCLVGDFAFAADQIDTVRPK